MLSYALFFYNIKITSVKGEIPIHTCMVLQTKAEQPLSRSSKATLPLMQDRQGAGQSSTQSIRPSLRTYLLQVSQHLFAGDKHHIQHRVRARVSFHKCVLSAHCPQPRLTMSQCDLGGVRQNRNRPTRSDMPLVFLIPRYVNGARHWPSGPASAPEAGSGLKSQ